MVIKIPFDGSIGRLIVKYAGIDKEYRQACELEDVAPVIGANAKLDNPQIGLLFLRRRARFIIHKLLLTNSW